jgi:hypothetical protein
MCACVRNERGNLPDTGGGRRVFGRRRIATPANYLLSGVGQPRDGVGEGMERGDEKYLSVLANLKMWSADGGAYDNLPGDRCIRHCIVVTSIEVRYTQDLRVKLLCISFARN